MQDKDSKNYSFVKSVSQYFMDFLETDFHKQRSPRRAIKLQNSESLLVGINLEKYPSFAKQVYGHIANGFDDTKTLSVSKNVHKSDVPKSLIDLVTLKVGKLAESTVKETNKKIATSSEEIAISHNKELVLAIEKAQSETQAIVADTFVTPFVESINESLQKLGIADEIIMGNISAELTDIIAGSLEEVVESIVQNTIAEEPIKSDDEIGKILSLDIAKEHIIDYFEELKINDLYTEVYELNQNQRILDKQDFYLYFGTIGYNKANYPIFYVPFEVKSTANSYDLVFDSRVFINKKSLDFIAQEYNAETGRNGKFKEIKERILYTAQYPGQSLVQKIDSITQELVNYFEIDGELCVYKPSKQKLRNSHVRLTNDSYISLYDKSDEALINDYEEILALDETNPLFVQLSDLVEGFVRRDPEPVTDAVDERWDSTEIPERLVSESPIPLNSEQQKILSALNDDKCRYVSVEGPPGTGKSHTITAVVFDAILKNHSVLVLSDKKEALDVVEDKIASTMNEVRFEDDFQNPVLRLGKTGNTYKQILSPSSIEKIRTNYKAVKKQFNELEDYLGNSVRSLREDLSAESAALEQVEMSELRELVNLEEHVTKNVDYIDFEEVINEPDSPVELEELRSNCTKVIDYLGSENAKRVAASIGYEMSEDRTLPYRKFKTIQHVGKIIQPLYQAIQENSLGESLNIFNTFSQGQVQFLYQTIKQYEATKKPIVGFKLSKAKVSQLDLQFSQDFDSTIVNAHQHLPELSNFYQLSQLILSRKDSFPENFTSKIDFVDFIFRLLKQYDLLNEALGFVEDSDYIYQLAEKYPNTSAKSNLSNASDVNFRNNISDATDLEFEKLLRYISLYQKIRGKFNAVPSYNYLNLKNQIEKVSAIKMTYLMDERVIDFYNHHASTVKVLKEIISSKEKFPRDEFMHLKNAFPCILAGIRDYAEYIPMESELFNLVIIDEASQVSVAQAFPALLRAKKVLILGDKLQFGNVKASQARSTVNTNYVNDLRQVFKATVAEDAAALKKLEYFNVKKSILDFFEFISNYRTMLRKHFRGYKENISFSNQYFYGNGLQVMKIRAKPVQDTIKFTVLEHDGKKDAVPNTNAIEIKYIKEQIDKLIKSGSNQTVGIITPHTNQQKKIAEEVYKSFDRDYLEKTLKLKVMTFDTCQGEERDIIFYSMVASKKDDKLPYIFSTDFSAGSYDDGLDDLRRQRLNVGLSRSKETMHFVLSKPIEEFSGAVRTALAHFNQQIEDAEKEKSPDTVDENSPMEKEVLNWFYQTDFWLKNKASIQFDTQFEIGEYLKQLDPTYTHPGYKVDFLLVYKDEAEKYHKIIIEYDGFNYHFTQPHEVNEFNYENYYSPEDLERQKVLESYGYKFLRINKFNMGNEPIKTLDSRISEVLVAPSLDNQSLLKKINNTVQGINNGEIRECPKCGEIKELSEFKDSSLLTGYGRFCMTCKQTVQPPKSGSRLVSTQTNTPTICGECGATMKLRSGRYGKFYGCSRFPYCRNTINLK